MNNSTPSQLHYWIGIALVIALIFGCTPSKDPGVLFTTKNARYVKGNAKHFQMRHDAKMKRKAEKLARDKNAMN